MISSLKHLSLLAILVLAGCGDVEPIVDPQPEKLITTKITIDGSIVIGDGEPLEYANKAVQTNNDLYGIQIYSRSDVGSPQTSYAYGLFDSPSIPSIDLVENQIYRIELTVVKDGRNAIGQDKTGFRLPFLMSSRGTPVLNSFVIDNQQCFNGLMRGVAELPITTGFKYKKYERPILNRYAAVLDNFTPSDGSPIVLSARRVVFGIRPKVEGYDGSIEVEFEGSIPFTVSASDSDEEREYLFALQGDGSAAWLVDHYTEKVKFSAIWTDSNGIETPLTPVGGQEIVVRRKTSYPLIIKRGSAALGSAISFEDDILDDGDQLIVGK